ncbi:MAG TPA: YHYH protein [Bacteroidia bacterium]|nr:YHYH protein [Bacteroidia bacterium]
MKLKIKKIVFSASIIIACVLQASAQLNPAITSWVLNLAGDTGYGGIPSNVTVVQYDTANVYISCASVPGYSIGPWAGDPNVPLNQNFVFMITLHPKQNTGTKTSPGGGQIGVWSNGVAIFNAWDAMSYNNQGYWDRNAYYFEGSSFDNCLGHPAPGGCYHNHVNPKCLYNDADSTHHSPIIGYAFDGYPIYGAYGYSNPNVAGAVRRMRSSYQLRTSMINRDTLPNGTILSSADYGPAVSGTYPLGDFLQDYKYIPGSGDLDTNNGRFCVTPEYPSGIYAYFVTIDSALNPVYPYTLGLTYYGIVQNGNTGPSGGHNTPTDSTKVYTTVPTIKKTITVSLDPNPVTDYAYFYIDPSSDNNIAGALYDITGKMLKAYRNLQPSMSYSIDFTSYPAGVYLLRLQTSNTSYTKKIVKVQ